jgi:hypothetical protein
MVFDEAVGALVFSGESRSKSDGQRGLFLNACRLNYGIVPISIHGSRSASGYITTGQFRVDPPPRGGRS